MVQTLSGAVSHGQEGAMLQLGGGADCGLLATSYDDPAHKLDLKMLRQEYDILRRENSQLRAALAEMERVAQRDTLTPLFNRRHFLSAMKKRLALLDRHEAFGAVVFVDVNQLKAINDQYGHAAGDLALVEVAERLQMEMAEDDLAARIGGDEFGLFLAVPDREAAQKRVDRIVAALQERPAIFDGHAITLSACFGVAMLRGGESGVSILAEADRDMYVSKKLAKARISA